MPTYIHNNILTVYKYTDRRKWN